MKKILTALSIASISYLSAAELTLDKPDYITTDTIKINFSEMDNHHKDWIGIYPEGSSTAWKNVVKWAWTENKSEGTLTFKNLPSGHYEVRGFYNNSYNVEASKDFWVHPSNHPGTKAELSATKDVFKTNEDVRINFKNINGATNDWLAIYPADKDNSWGNVVKWKFNKGGVKEGQANFDKLPAGKYEARIFYNNTFKMEGKVAFEVREMVVPDDNKVFYEGAENGFDQKWTAVNPNNPPVIINEAPKGSLHSVRVPTSGASFSFNNLSKDMKNLILDLRVGKASHRGNFGVKIKTKKGNRRVVFASYLNHPNNDMSGHATPTKPFSIADGYILMFPAPTDYYLSTRNGIFTHFEINIEKKLQILEPDNELISITHFTSAGGDFDNIQLAKRSRDK